jgi:glycosyltransferase involved in cell wall biosynthesis
MAPNKRRQIGILALSAIADDPRVRRQGDAFHAAGWEVIAFGLSGSGRSPAPVWPIVGCDAATVWDPEFPDEAPAEEDPEDSVQDQRLSHSPGDEGLTDTPQDESLDDWASDKALTEWQIVGCDTATVWDPEFPDEAPDEAPAEEDPEDSVQDRRLSHSPGDEGLTDTPQDESLDDWAGDKALTDLSTATSSTTVAQSGRLRSTLKHVLPLPVRDVLRPYSTWASLRGEVHVALQKYAAPPNRLRSILKHLLPLPVRDAVRPYSTWASLRAEMRIALQKCVRLLPNGPAQFARRCLRAVSRVRSSVIHTVYRVRHVWRLLLIRVFPRYADEVFWTLNGALVDLYHAASRHRPAIWLANDWTSLPVAQRLAEEQNVPFGYDTHELATSEYGHRAKWRILYQPLILALERRGIAAASVLSCVSDGIAGHLQRLYRLEQRPMVVRNMPHYESLAFRPTSNSIRVLYHGIVAPGRGLEACIFSVPQWAEGRSLSIRGPAQDVYRAELEALIAEEGVGDRVTLLPPVPMIDLIREATAFDVGIFIFPSANRHNVYVLPNKIFEYVMAGLAVCVSALPEMAAVVRGHDLGVLVEGMEPEKIAAAINSLDRARVDQF